MNKSEFYEQLVHRYVTNRATGEELETFFHLLETGEIRDTLEAYLGKEAAAMAAGESNVRPIGRKRNGLRIMAAAASLLLGLGAGAYLLWPKPGTDQIAQNQPEQLAPKQRGITLTLANGKHIVIDQKHHGQLKTEDGAVADQTGDAIAYTARPEAAPVMQTLTNNSGNKFRLQLADGTDVYLDARSTITYPTAFTGKERKVSITGQAYFKVKHKADQPFFVTAKSETVEDIGTEFNINAYEEESVLKTTLVEGAVKINHTLLLKPGEQAQFGADGLKAVPADIEAVTAWLQGKMVFHHEPLESILTRVSRIYDVKIVWLDEALKQHKFGGSVSRTKQLATVLNFFRSTGEVDFLVEGKTVKVFKPKKK